MFKQPTVIVLGAGASHEVGMPLGEELKEKISHNLHQTFYTLEIADRNEWDIIGKFTQQFIFETGSSRKYWLRNFLPGFSLLYQITTELHKDRQNPSIDTTPPNEDTLSQQDIWEIENQVSSTLTSLLNIYKGRTNSLKIAMPHSISIDNYLEAHSSDNELIAISKFGMTASIILSEKSAKLTHEKRSEQAVIQPGMFTHVWFDSFFKKLNAGVKREDVRSIFKNITIINFNYDRCTEEYLYRSLQAYYHISPQEATEVMKTLTIYHPYGVIAPLNWQDPENGVAFGGKYKDANHLVECALNLKTFSEQVAETKDLTDMRTALQHAEKTIWLGFAFHEQNMDLIAPAGAHNPQEQECYATACGISEPNRRRIEEDLKSRFGIKNNELHVKDVTCTTLFQDYHLCF